MPLLDTTDELRLRYNGCRRTGTVALREFDTGMVETLGGRLFFGQSLEPPDPATCTPEELAEAQPNYFVPDGVVPSVPSPPGAPGIPITWSQPEDLVEKYRVPVFWFQRDDVAPALNRWHPGLLQYRAPAAGAKAVGDPANGNFDRYEQSQQAVPFDITYTLSIESRTGVASRNNATRMFMYALRVFQPYHFIVVRDSLGDVRTYESFMEGTNPLDEVSEVTGRRLGFTLSIRVEAELDLNDPAVFAAVTSDPVLNLSQVP